MKVLLLPNNIGSMTAITVQALNDAGHQAVGLILGDNKKQSHRNLKVYPYEKGGILSAFNFLRWFMQFLRYVLWADVIHWNGSFSIPLLKVALPVIRFFKKPALVEFVGSDIRIPEIEFEDNPYFKKMFDSGLYEYLESETYSKTTQQLFSSAGFGAIVLPGLEQHIDKDLFNRRYHIYQRILVKEFKPVYPAKSNRKPLIIHSPSAPIAKGTDTIVNAIENLKSKYDFDFKLVKNLPHQEAIALLKNADIFIDQLNGGHYGMASMEAMAFGKPTVCYIKDFVLNNNLPKDVPVVIATHDNLQNKIEELLNDAELRHDIGIKSRLYMEKYHDAPVEVLNLVDIYKREINSNK